MDERCIRVSSTPVTTRAGLNLLLDDAIVPCLDPASHLHAAFFASDYQLSRLERIGAVTPRLSIFEPLSARRDIYSAWIAETERTVSKNGPEGPGTDDLSLIHI